ncbi:MAG: nitroreductase family protein [Gammaproteobacteria bacterium]|nr:nitroreductase family protein [Gammaproteobacteria bacterium]
MATTTTLPLTSFRELPEPEMLRAAREFRELMQRRRTVRTFDSRPVPRELIADCIAAAGTAPSGANQQPWHFIAVSDPGVKRAIRLAAEKEERLFYEQRATDAWLRAVAPMETDWQKPFLEIAPWLIAIFVQKWGTAPDGSKVKHYYPTESVGIATGILITALHVAGLATLTHTPSPMGFLNEILGRPADTERPFLLLVAGYPAAGTRVPDITRKPPAAIVGWLESK